MEEKPSWFCDMHFAECMTNVFGGPLSSDKQHISLSIDKDEAFEILVPYVSAELEEEPTKNLFLFL